MRASSLDSTLRIMTKTTLSALFNDALWLVTRRPVDRRAKGESFREQRADSSLPRLEHVRYETNCLSN